MSLSRLLILCFVTSTIGEQVTPSCSNDAALDDTASFIQSRMDVKPGTSHAKLSEKQDSESATSTESISSEETTSSLLKKGLAEFLAMTLFVFIGCGSACANGCADAQKASQTKSNAAGTFQVALTFGFAITAIAYSIGHISGGQINCAVTFGLYINGNITWKQGLVNLGCQLVGSLLGAFLTWAVFGDAGTGERDATGGLATNSIQPGFSAAHAFIGEVLGTFILVFTVLQTAINSATSNNRALACMAIGISVFLAHSVLIRVDGCSINPTRSFGPMVARAMLYNNKDNDYLRDHWVFWVGPLAGAASAAGVYMVL